MTTPTDTDKPTTTASATPDKVRERLEHIRQELRAERISYGELAELDTLKGHIPADDVELREAAGLPEERTIPAEKPTANNYGGGYAPTPQDHIRDLHDAATRFEDRAKRAEAHADKLAEAAKALVGAGKYARDGVCTLSTQEVVEMARKALAAYESEVR